MLQLTLDQARTLMITCLGLENNSFNSTTLSKDGVLETIRQINLLQIDTINVVARSPYLVLWSRLGNFEVTWLDQLLSEGALFEYWAHEASFLPIEDYSLFRLFMVNPAPRRRARDWIEAHPEVVKKVLNLIQETGPVRASNFKRDDGLKAGWWNWKPEKMALEMLFTSGDLMISTRHNFQRIYDLRERVLAGWDDSTLATPPEVHRALVIKATRALGLAQINWIPDYFRTKKQLTISQIPGLVEEGILQKIKVEGFEEPFLINFENLDLVKMASEGELQARRTTLLSPFDPLVWDRNRLKALFDFDYRIECYTPASKRQYGYFNLPILHRGKLVGRLDPKAHRKEGIFEIKSLFLEPGINPQGNLPEDLAEPIQNCATWHKTPRVIIGNTVPPDFKPLLEKSLEKIGTILMKTPAKKI